MFAGSEYFNVQDFNDFLLRLLLLRAKGVEWSILVEFRFYIILPVIILILKEFPKLISSSITSQRWMVLLGLISCILWADMTRPPIGLDSLRPYISTFLMGIAAAYITESFDDRLLGISKWLQHAFDVVGMLALIIIICLTPAVYGHLIGEVIPLNYFHGRMTEFSFLWTIIIIACLYGGGVMRKLLGLSWLRLMGALSYGIYLWHPPIVKFVERNVVGQPLYKSVIVLVLVTLISFITYYLVERPFMRISINKLAVR
jgi:peptidoglycan/LPS O-acetylase OafA/YrhL